MQRILQPGEIESLDHNHIPQIRLPEVSTLFHTRAQRLRQLAGTSPIKDYLLLMAALVEAQQSVVTSFKEALLEEGKRWTPSGCMTEAMHDPQWQALWQTVLTTLLTACRGDHPVIKTLLEMPSSAREAQLQALMQRQDDQIDPASAPFLMAALQVMVVGMTSAFQASDIALTTSHAVCPCCGSPPVASVVRIDGQYSGYRYLHCAVCATEWHRVRVQCTYCASTQGIAYHVAQHLAPAAEEGNATSAAVPSAAIKCETCDHCEAYLKIFYQEKDPFVEPLADDLASVTLDLLMANTPYRRLWGNPLLLQRCNA